VLSVAFERKQPSQIIHLSNPVFHLQTISTTFHGRDIFAPVAAHLSLGVPVKEFGEKLDSFVELVVPISVRQEQQVNGEVVYVDTFGNLFTNIRRRDLTGLTKERLRIILGATEIGGLATNYASVVAGEFACLFNSWGFLEIAVNKGNAHQRTGAKVGDKVTVASKD
jgi:S-adenosylmethionine hydrolase